MYFTMYKTDFFYLIYIIVYITEAFLTFLKILLFQTTLLLSTLSNTTSASEFNINKRYRFLLWFLSPPFQLTGDELQSDAVGE